MAEAPTGFLHVVRVSGLIDPVHAEYGIAFAPLDGRLRGRRQRHASGARRAHRLPAAGRGPDSGEWCFPSRRCYSAATCSKIMSVGRGQEIEAVELGLTRAAGGDDSQKLLKLLTRLVIAVETLVGIEAPAKPTAPTLTPEELRDRARKSVAVIRRGAQAPEWDGRGLPPAGGVDPATFWGRKEK